jgi:hypothetical protein
VGFAVARTQRKQRHPFRPEDKHRLVGRGNRSQGRADCLCVSQGVPTGGPRGQSNHETGCPVSLQVSRLLRDQRVFRQVVYGTIAQSFSYL